MTRPIDFWFSIGSTYTFLTVMRLDKVERDHGLTFTFRPFSVRVIMVEQNNVPFRGKPVKAAYMWRDITRRAEARGLSTRLPAPYPLEGFDLANQVAVVEEPAWESDPGRASCREPGIEVGLGAVVDGPATPGEVVEETLGGSDLLPAAVADR